MKKQEIKRRKRVVPAVPDLPSSSSQQQPPLNYSPHQPHQPTPRSFDSSVSPDPSTTLSEPLDPYPSTTTTATAEGPASHRAYGPPAVDFTNFYQPAPSSSSSSTTAYAHQQTPQQHQQQPSPQNPSPRKRSLSVVEADDTAAATAAPAAVNGQPSNRASSISSILNPTGTRQASLDAAIDPSLAALGRGGGSSSSGGGGGGGGGGGAGGAIGAVPVALMGSGVGEREDKARRKERLRVEAEAMRENLRRMERELESLDADEG